MELILFLLIVYLCLSLVLDVVRVFFLLFIIAALAACLHGGHL